MECRRDVTSTANGSLKPSKACCPLALGSRVSSRSPCLPSFAAAAAAAAAAVLVVVVISTDCLHSIDTANGRGRRAQNAHLPVIREQGMRALFLLSSVLAIVCTSVAGHPRLTPSCVFTPLPAPLRRYSPVHSAQQLCHPNEGLVVTVAPPWIPSSDE
jgi:hypothetical protein